MGNGNGNSYANGPGCQQWLSIRPVTFWDFTEGRPTE